MTPTPKPLNAQWNACLCGWTKCRECHREGLDSWEDLLDYLGRSRRELATNQANTLTDPTTHNGVEGVCPPY